MIGFIGPALSGKTRELRDFVRINSFFAAHPEQLSRLAFEVLEMNGTPVRQIDDVEAEAHFAECSQDLLTLEWEELIAGTIDPEIPGLRSPARFLESAFRLIRKLADAAISPQTFLDTALSGGTHFYAKPPNFAHPELILATKEQYRDSLDVTNGELQRQYRREVDLAKVLAKLYSSYEESVRSRREMTGRDAMLAAADALKSNKLRIAVSNRYPQTIVDDAQEATPAMRKMLEGIYGPDLSGVIVAGDPDAATSTFRGARADSLLSAIKDGRKLSPDNGKRAAIETHRAKNQTDEAEFVAAAVRAKLEAGVPASEIALIFRSVSDVHIYEDALIDRDIPVAVSGDVNIFADRRALDALALLWNVWDPYRHDYLLRTLGGRALGLSDASLAALCAEPPDAQEPLIAFDPEPAPTERAKRFDPRRDLRLGWNVIRGTADTGLEPTARERLREFRAKRTHWLELLNSDSLDVFIETVWREGLARDGAPDSARALAQQLVLRRLFDRLMGYAQAHPDASLGDILTYAQVRSETTLEACEASRDPRYVNILDIDRARGRNFDFVIIPDARAGSFPRWYVPDAFLFSPKLGMIPKENVGDARAARTAKFTYYVHRAKTNKAYNDEERRAFLYAMARARSSVLITASGKATRGVTAPEFLEEYRKK